MSKWIFYMSYKCEVNLSKKAFISIFNNATHPYPILCLLLVRGYSSLSIGSQGLEVSSWKTRKRRAKRTVHAQSSLAPSCICYWENKTIYPGHPRFRVTVHVLRPPKSGREQRLLSFSLSWFLFAAPCCCEGHIKSWRSTGGALQFNCRVLTDRPIVTFVAFLNWRLSDS